MTVGHPEAKPELGKELQAITAETGAGIVRAGNRTFVVVEIKPESVTADGEVYLVTDPEEAADCTDAVKDENNPTHTTNAAMTSCGLYAPNAVASVRWREKALTTLTGCISGGNAS